MDKNEKSPLHRRVAGSVQWVRVPRPVAERRSARAGNLHAGGSEDLSVGDGVSIGSHHEDRYRDHFAYTLSDRTPRDKDRTPRDKVNGCTSS